MARSSPPLAHTEPIRVLHAAAEWFPLVKTGGLADVTAALPVAQRALGIDSRLLLPGFPALREALEGRRVVAQLGPAFGAARVTLLLGRLPNCPVPAYLIDAPWLYARAGNPYLGPEGTEWPDNPARFALLGWVAAQMAEGELDPDWSAQVVHAHDWHAALAPVYLGAHGASGTSQRRARSVLTIHNLAFQGRFPLDRFDELSLPGWMLSLRGIEFHGDIRFLKGGLLFADRITTVSPTYAREILTPAEGQQLESVLQHRSADLSGIVNGIDETVWNPVTDRVIAARFDARDLSGKLACKRALQIETGLQRSDDAPLMAVVSRLSHQKGLDLLLSCAPHWLQAGGQIALLGSGDGTLEADWMQAAREHPDRISVHIGYDEPRAHRVVAGADLIGVPSRFEPCGLTQLYGLRYGTLPLVHRVGGLADTVVDADDAAIKADRATGFGFTGAHQDALIDAMNRALALWPKRPTWERVMRRAMAQESSWIEPATRYGELYAALAQEALPAMR